MKKTKGESIMDQFNLPSYTKGKTFAEASKAIAKKFEGRTDKESVDTLQELQGRLQQAQEYIKQQSQPKEEPAAPPQQGPTNDHFLGGLIEKLGEGALPGLGAVTGAVDSISGFKEGNTAQGVGGIAKAGLGLIPGGSLVSPAVDAITGMFGGNKDKTDYAEETYKQTHKANNDYAGGGFMNNTDPNELIKMLGTDPKKVIADGEQTIKEIEFFQEKGRRMDKVSGATAAPLNPLTVNRTHQPIKGTNAPLAEFTDELPSAGENLGDRINTSIQGYGAKEATQYEDVEKGYDPSQLLRYAPAVTDAYQLATLEKPEDVSRGRLGNKYQSQQVDETQLQKGVQEGINNQRDAILGSSGGSGATARANLLGLSLNGTKALSAAMQSATGENRADNVRGQQFDLGIDQTNLAQSNTEALANEQNEGAYDTQKSQLIAQLGSNVGEIGKEQLFKKYPELMGMDFNAMGKYLKTKKKKSKIG